MTSLYNIKIYVNDISCSNDWILYLNWKSVTDNIKDKEWDVFLIELYEYCLSIPEEPLKSENPYF